MSMRWPHGWPASPNTPKPPPPLTARVATSIARRKPPARRRWPPRPRSWPTIRRSGRSPATGCATILDEWKTISGLDRKTDDALWKRYSAARETFNRRRGSHFAELDRDRAGPAKSRSGSACRPKHSSTPPIGVRPAPSSASYSPTGKPPDAPPRDVDDALWHRFKAAQDTFFKARNAATAERDAEFHANATAKEALLAEAEKLDTSNHEAARSALRTIGDKWDAIGKVPRERSADLERRLRAVEKKVRDAGESDWADPQAQARAEQFRERVEQFERQAQKAEAAGRTKEAEQARANAEQWRQWADAAADALTKKR